MSQVKSVTLVFENCEEITFDRKDIGDFYVDNIRESVSRCACNSISKYKHCDKVFLALRSSADTKYDCFGGQSEDTSFERITKFHDITQIDIAYDDGARDSCNVPWKDKDGGDAYTNYAQSSYINKLGDLYLMISETDNVQDEIDDSEINNKEYMDAYWNVMS